MNNKKVSIGVGIALVVIVAITVGVFVWKYEKQARSTLQMSDMNSRKDQLMSKNPWDNFKISDFNSWKDYKNESFGLEIKYPQELYISNSDDKIVFDYLSPDDPNQKNEGSTLLHFNISKEQKTIEQYIAKNKLDTLQNFKQARIKLNEFLAEQLTYTDAFAGGTMYIILIQNEDKLIIIDYAGNNQLEDTFGKMLSTVNIYKIEKVSFCGKIYKANQITINNIDIAGSIANISKKETQICKNLELGKFQESGIHVTQKKDVFEDNSYLVNFSHMDNDAERDDPFNRSPFIFKFNFQNNIVSYQNQFDGSFEVLGNIK
ncbi:MAG: hypothetical protein PHT88_01120 [Candidatus Moranbacteria bacterium]|nr:hypothetical protein [Candidatus Moranbacteria bacterium]